jgi:hypothetical protein
MQLKETWDEWCRFTRPEHDLDPVFAELVEDDHQGTQHEHGPAAQEQP